MTVFNAIDFPTATVDNYVKGQELVDSSWISPGYVGATLQNVGAFEGDDGIMMRGGPQWIADDTGNTYRGIAEQRPSILYLKLTNGNAGILHHGQIVDSNLKFNDIASGLGNWFSVLATFAALVAAGGMVSGVNPLTSVTQAAATGAGETVAAQIATSGVYSGLPADALKAIYSAGLESGETLADISINLAANGANITEMANAITGLNAATQGALLQGASITAFYPNGTFSLTAPTMAPPIGAPPTLSPSLPTTGLPPAPAVDWSKLATGALPGLVKVVTAQKPLGTMPDGTPYYTQPGTYQQSSNNNLLIVGGIALAAILYAKSKPKKGK